MANDTGSKPKADKAQTREDRLKAALKANLARRKAQNRLRGQGPQTKTQPDKTGQDKDS